MNLSGIHATAKLDFPVAGAIPNDIIRQGSVEFGLSVRFNAMYRYGDVVSYVTSVDSCPELNLPFSMVQNTFTVNGSHPCSIEVGSTEDFWG